VTPSAESNQTKENKMAKRGRKPKENNGESDTKRPVQTEIPGTERPKIKAIDVAAELYVNLRDKMQMAVKTFKEAKTALSVLMHKHEEKIGKDGEGVMRYRYDDMLVEVTPKDETLKVRHCEDEESVEVGKAPEDNSEGEV
jgi:hypothetical protein